MANLEAELQKKILNKLMFVQDAKYSELEALTDNHDLFNYHLRELTSRDYIEKKGSTYSLTSKGRQYVAFMEEDGQLQKQIKVGMFILLVRQNNGVTEMLLHKRLKHPHYGYIGAVSGKLKWGDSLDDNLARELKEELDVVPTEYKLTGVIREVFSDENSEKVGDGVFFEFIVEKWEGTPTEKNEEGEYFWYEIDKILELENIFRTGFEKGIPHIKKYLQDKTRNYKYLIENGTEGLKY